MILLLHIAIAYLSPSETRVWHYKALYKFTFFTLLYITPLVTLTFDILTSKLIRVTTEMDFLSIVVRSGGTSMQWTKRQTERQTQYTIHNAMKGRIMAEMLI